MKHLATLFTADNLKGQLLRGSVAGLVIQALAILAGLVSSIVLARVLGPEEYGVYAFVFALISVLALPVQMGLPTLIVRETAKAVAQCDWPLLRGIWTWGGRTIAVGSTAMILLILLFLAIIGDHISSTRYTAFLWGLPLIPLLALGEARAAALRGLGRIVEGQFPDQVLRQFLLALFVAGVYWVFASPVHAHIALGLGSLAGLITFAVGAMLLSRARPPGLLLSPGRRMEHRQWIRALIPLSVIMGLQIINGNTAIVFLGLLRDDSDVGIYRVALSISTIATFGLMTFYMVTQPYIVRLYSLGDWQRLQVLASAVALAAFLATILVVTVFYFAGVPILDILYGKEYLQAHGPLMILMIGSAIHATVGMGGGLLTMTGNERYVLRSTILTAILNLFLNAVLIPVYGIKGAAWASAFSLVAGQLFAYMIARVHLELDGSPLYIFGAISKRKLKI